MSGQRILVVEDQENLMKAVQEVLELEGYIVLVASDGLKALEVMEHTRPDLIVADIMMPRMDGYGLYEAVRARPEWITIPFIFLTGKAERDDILRGKSLGVEDYITKPFNPDELLVVVRSRLTRAQQIYQASEAKFNELKQQIITVMGHELRTPLTYVQGYTELALDDVRTLSPDQLQGFLLGIKKGADRLNHLIEDLLLIVQMDTGRLAEEYAQIARVRTDLDMIVERAVNRYNSQAAAHGITLESQITPNLPPVVLSEYYLTDALGRLIDNAIKFTRGQNKRIKVIAQPAGSWVEIAIIDQGVGIAAEEIPHLFQRFHQIDRQRMEQQGVGLGLAISQEFIHLHKGEILVTSEPGKGSTFTIRLPVAA